MGQAERERIIAPWMVVRQYWRAGRCGMPGWCLPDGSTTACYLTKIWRSGGMSVQALRDQAERCKRLANSIYNPAAAAQLEAHARALEEQAKRLEAARLGAPLPTTR